MNHTTSYQLLGNVGVLLWFDTRGLSTVPLTSPPKLPTWGDEIRHTLGSKRETGISIKNQFQSFTMDELVTTSGQYEFELN
jgi:hypothetical protein